MGSNIHQSHTVLAAKLKSKQSEISVIQNIPLSAVWQERCSCYTNASHYTCTYDREVVAAAFYDFSKVD